MILKTVVKGGKNMAGAQKHLKIVQYSEALTPGTVGANAQTFRVILSRCAISGPATAVF
jgi:hypothetical protein